MDKFLKSGRPEADANGHCCDAGCRPSCRSSQCWASFMYTSSRSTRITAQSQLLSPTLARALLLMCRKRPGLRLQTGRSILDVKDGQHKSITVPRCASRMGLAWGSEQPTSQLHECPTLLRAEYRLHSGHLHARSLSLRRAASSLLRCELLKDRCFAFL